METTNREIAEARGGIIINLQAVLAVCQQERVHDLIHKASNSLDKLCAAGSAMNANHKTLQTTIDQKDQEIVRLQNRIKDKAIEDKADADAIHTLLKDHYSAMMASIPGASTTNARVEKLAIENADLKEIDGKLRAKIAALDDENQEQHSKIKTLRGEVQDFEENWEAYMTEKNGAIKLLKEEKEELINEKNETIKAMEKEKNSAIKGLKEQNEVLQEKNKDLQEDGKIPMTEDDAVIESLKEENRKLKKQAEGISAFIMDVKFVFDQFGTK